MITPGVFLAALVVLLVFTAVGTVLWRRFYRDDAANQARRIFKNSAVPLVLRLIVRAFDLAFAFVLLGALPAAAIGPYTLAALLVVQYLGTITEFGLGVLLTREVARDPNAAQRLFSVTLTLRLALVFGGAVPLALLLNGAYMLLDRLGVGAALTVTEQQTIAILLLTLIPAAYSGAVTALYHAAERMEVPALIELITAIISFVARIGVIWLGLGIIGLAWAAVGVSTLTALIYLGLQARTFFAPRFGWDRALVRWMVPTALPLMLNNLLSAVFFRFDLFIIRGLSGENAELLVQQYGMPYQVLGIALILPPVITFAVFPLLSRRASGERAALRAAQDRTLQVLLMLAFPLAMGLTMLAPLLVLIFTRDQFPDYNPISVHVLAILAWFLPFSFVNGLLQYALIAINRQRAITRAFIIGALFNLVANILTFPLFGLYAASVITILSELVLLAVFLPVLRQEELTPALFGLAWRPALAALLMGAAMFGCLQLGGWLGPLLAIIVAAPVYGLGLWLLGAFGAEERALVLRIIGRDNPAEPPVE